VILSAAVIDCRAKRHLLYRLFTKFNQYFIKL